MPLRIVAVLLFLAAPPTAAAQSDASRSASRDAGPDARSSMPVINSQGVADRWAKTIASDFTFDFYRATREDRPNDSFCCSPYSVLSVLAVAAHGASGEGREEFAKQWKLPPQPPSPPSSPARPKPTASTAAWPSKTLLTGLRSLTSSMLLSDVQRRAAEIELGRLERDLTKIGDQGADVFGAPVGSSKAEAKKIQSMQERVETLKKQLARSEISIANAVWVDRSMPLKESFAEVVSGEYGATIEPADFVHAAPIAVQRINDWCKEKTKGRIEEIVDSSSVNSETRMVLTNAIYFKADWKNPFDKARTKLKNFFTLAGGRATWSMMHDFQTAPFAEIRPDGSKNVAARGKEPRQNDLGWKILELPYKDERFSLVVILPNQKRGLPALEEKLNLESFEKWRTHLRDRPVEIAIPRFKLESIFSCDATLQSLGLRSIFEQGNLLGVSDSDEAKTLYVNAVFQKTWIEVDEKGTEAAAVTAGPAGGGGSPSPPPEFIADHPFLYLIRDSRSGVILFIGRFTGEGKE